MAMPGGHFIIALALAALALLAGGPLQADAKGTRKGTAQTRAENANTLNREILGLFDSRQEGRAEETRLHRRLEMPLNHLGYKLTLHDLAGGLPEPASARRYQAIATWFHDRLPEAPAYLAWAARAAKAGAKFIVLESPGALGDADLPAINRFLQEIGLSYADNYVTDTAHTRINAYDASILGFEHRLDPAMLPGHQVVAARAKDVKVHLSVTDPAHASNSVPEGVLVSTGPKGGFITTGFAVHYVDETDRMSWIVDPFAFLEQALGGGLRPIPDTTTVSGRRLYFSHIDGDGWNNFTEIEPYGAQGSPAAQALLDLAIAPYPDLPVSVGLITGDADPKTGGRTTAEAIARRMFALPQVEAASHTHTHPYAWDYFADYDREREIIDILNLDNRKAAYGEGDDTLGPLIASWRDSIDTDEKELAALEGEKKQVSMPRALPHEPFDLEQEVAGSLKAVSDMAPPGKKAALYLWSGNTRPFEAAVSSARAARVANLNGGDSRFDSVYASLGYVAPLSRMAGRERQIYAVNSNENTYTNGWTGPYDAFKLLSETLDNTERPRRLRGFNLYYHAFSATKKAGADVIVAHLERARASTLAPITASQYARIGEGFFSTQIVAAGRDRWRIGDRGALDTVRFDSAGDAVPDYAASQGVAGHVLHQDSLYVALDPAQRDVLIALTRESAGSSARKARPYLSDSRWLFSGVEAKGCVLSARAQGYGAGEMTWGGFAPGLYDIEVARAGKLLARLEGDVGGDGRLALTLEADAISPVDIKISCRTSNRLETSAIPAAHRRREAHQQRRLRR